MQHYLIVIFGVLFTISITKLLCTDPRHGLIVKHRIHRPYRITGNVWIYCSLFQLVSELINLNDNVGTIFGGSMFSIVFLCSFFFSKREESPRKRKNNVFYTWLCYIFLLTCIIYNLKFIIKLTIRLCYFMLTKDRE